jgi:dihydroorotate dehydrogenase
MSDVSVMGLSFRTPVGLAAGFDKHGEFVQAAAEIGFGFIEVGTVTPRPEPGHNPGVGALVDNLRRLASSGVRRRIVLGVSVGMNLLTPLGQAAEDYLAGLRRVWAHADFVTINLSSPAARGLGEAGREEMLCALLARLQDEQARLAARGGRRVPLAVKLGLDPSAPGPPEVVRHIARHRIDALIAAIGPGDRGAAPEAPADPLTREHGARFVRELTSWLDGTIPVISVGGIASPDDARQRLEAGAALIQLHRGFVAQGPGLVRRIDAYLRGRPIASAIETPITGRRAKLVDRPTAP